MKRSRRAAKPKKPKLYKRYDPFTGAMVQVTRDDPRYDEWRHTRGTVASRKKQMLRDDPVEYAQTFGKQTVERQVGRTVRRAGGRIARKALPYIAAGGATAGLYAAAITGGLAIAAGGYVVMDRVARNQRLKLGERLNEISREFVRLQAAIKQRVGAREWMDVPAEVRKKALADYQRALGTATAQAQGSAVVGVRESYK